MAALQLVPRVSLNKILFTTDFSDYAERALPYAVGLARHYGGTVFVAHAIPPEPRRPLPLEPMPPELDELRYKAKRALDTFVRSAPSPACATRWFWRRAQSSRFFRIW
jgi:nucleotide-binding universal stress UspA family protein